MKNDNETILDILAEIRERADAMQTHGTTHGIRLAIREFADRIEAAWERECKAIATEHAILPAVCITKPSGNAAAMRDALENSNGLLEELAAIGEWGESAREQIAENNAALSAPPRNCDLYSTNEDAWRSYQLSHPEGKVVHDYIDWLFAPTEKGGAE